MVEPRKPDRVAGGRISRVAPLVGLAGRTAGEAVVASLRNRRRGERDSHADSVEFHTRNADRYAERLGRSRGVLMKAGQILSVVMPESGVESDYRGIYQAALARLQDDAPPMPAEQAIEMITGELRRPPAEVFAEFDPEPVAAASIGQVHAATLPDGRRVAVKVQYPGVEQAIRADLANTELLATFLRLLVGVVPNMGRSDVRAMAREISDRIGEEIDYRVEAANQQEFADAYRGHPFIRIPEVLPELSTRRVLTMDFADGLRYAKAVRAEQELKDRWAEVVFRFTVDTVHGLGLVNTDAHPGNYLFHPDGTVTFLDFGCVKRLTPDQVRTVVGLVRLIAEQDAEGLHQWLLEAGWIKADDGITPAELLGWWSDGYRYLLPPQPLTITPQVVATMLRDRFSHTGPSGRVPRKLNLPADFIMPGRMDSGMYAVLGGLHATGPWNAIREEYHSAGPPATVYGELDAAFRAARR
jgi:predicted unusual protein kinase regulating ubiquinone biosynthesis (AarF/ABC1/UbiB family)